MQTQSAGAKRESYSCTLLYLAQQVDLAAQVLVLGELPLVEDLKQYSWSECSWRLGLSVQAGHALTATLPPPWLPTRVARRTVEKPAEVQNK